MINSKKECFYNEFPSAEKCHAANNEIFSASGGSSVVEWNLICNAEVQIAFLWLIQSFGLMLGGYFLCVVADEHGRLFVNKLCVVGMLFAGVACMYATTY